MTSKFLSNFNALQSHLGFKIFMLWHPLFAKVKVNHRSVYSCILAKVCAVAMATDLVKNKA